MQTKPRRTVLGFRLLTVVIGLLLLLIIGVYSIRTLRVSRILPAAWTI